MFETLVDKLSSEKEVMTELEEKLQKVRNFWCHLLFGYNRNGSLLDQ